MIKKLIKKFLLRFGVHINRVSGNFGEEKKFELNKTATPLEWLKGYKVETVLDVGANEGQFVYKILEIFPEAKIYCFEPIKGVFDFLKSKFNDKVNLYAYNFGLGEIDEEKFINLNEYSPSSSMLEMLETHKSNFDFAIKTEPTSISIRRLDDVFNKPLKKPVLLKVDVQGYEMNVLKGGDSIVRQSDVIIIETTFVPLYKDQPLFDEIYSHLKSRGFRYAGNIEQLISPKNNQILQADAVFIKS